MSSFTCSYCIAILYQLGNRQVYPIARSSLEQSVGYFVVLSIETSATETKWFTYSPGDQNKQKRESAFFILGDRAGLEATSDQRRMRPWEHLTMGSKTGCFVERVAGPGGSERDANEWMAKPVLGTKSEPPSIAVA